jgi:hypothetical protein
MRPKRKLEYFLLRYAPDEVKEEFVNIGLVLNELEANGAGFADVRFTKDWSRVSCIDPQADIAGLQYLTREIAAQFAQLKNRAALLRWLEDLSSNLIQLSEPKGVLTDNPEAEMEIMASMYLERAKIIERAESVAARRASGRQKIYATMRDAFDRAGVGKLVLPIPVAPYTKPGDPFKFDFGYRFGDINGKGGEIKLFHAVSLKTNVEAAIVLAARYPRIVPVMSAKTDASVALTAVIDDDLDGGQEAVQFALSTMEEERIRVAVAAEMLAIAEAARKDLRV